MSTETTYKMKAFELAGVALKHAAWVHDYDQGATGEEGKQLFAKHKPVISEKEIEDIVVRTQQRCVASGIPQDKMDKIVAALRSNASAPNATRETVQKQAEAEVAFAIAEVAKERAEQAAEMTTGQKLKLLEDMHKAGQETIKAANSLITKMDAVLEKTPTLLSDEARKAYEEWKEAVAKYEKEQKELKSALEKELEAAGKDEAKRKEITDRYLKLRLESYDRFHPIDEKFQHGMEKEQTRINQTGSEQDKQDMQVIMDSHKEYHETAVVLDKMSEKLKKAATLTDAEVAYNGLTEEEQKMAALVKAHQVGENHGVASHDKVLAKKLDAALAKQEPKEKAAEEAKKVGEAENVEQAELGGFPSFPKDTSAKPKLALS